MSARRYPAKPYLVFYDTLDQLLPLQGRGASGWPATCSRTAASRKGDRVLLYTQNSPQYVIGYYAILRANAVVVPVNPMNLTLELRHYVEDSGAGWRSSRRSCSNASGR